ncbi:hypothetical protein B1C81_35630 [Streptomyces sp. HG99]|nr:hypothetical protein B1C81_35630 [Streptomyces sp. HG99]
MMLACSASPVKRVTRWMDDREADREPRIVHRRAWLPRPMTFEASLLWIDAPIAGCDGGMPTIHSH